MTLFSRRVLKALQLKLPVLCMLKPPLTSVREERETL